MLKNERNTILFTLNSSEEFQIVTYLSHPTERNSTNDLTQVLCNFEKGGVPRVKLDSFLDFFL